MIYLPATTAILALLTLMVKPVAVCHDNHDPFARTMVIGLNSDPIRTFG
jgi:hypothetical protein